MESTGSLWVENGSSSKASAPGKQFLETTRLSELRMGIWKERRNGPERFIYRIWDKGHGTLLPIQSASNGPKDPDYSGHSLHGNVAHPHNQINSKERRVIFFSAPTFSILKNSSSTKNYL